MKTKAVVIVVVFMAILCLTPIKVFAFGEELAKASITVLLSMLSNKGDKSDSIEKEIIQRGTAGLIRSGNSVSDVKLIGITTLATELNVAYFSLRLNGSDGALFYLMEKGKTVQSNRPANLEEFRGFLVMNNLEKKQYLKALFEKVLKVRISDDGIVEDAKPTVQSSQAQTPPLTPPVN